MLEHFLSPEVDGKLTQALFDGLKIHDHLQTIQTDQGQYPVISVSLKDIKVDTFADCLDMVGIVMSDLYQKFRSQSSVFRELSFYLTIGD